jgi:hypothetical protein
VAAASLQRDVCGHAGRRLDSFDEEAERLHRVVVGGCAVVGGSERVDQRAIVGWPAASILAVVYSSGFTLAELLDRTSRGNTENRPFCGFRRGRALLVEQGLNTGQDWWRLGQLLVDCR